MKQCSKCKEWKDFSEFGKRSDAKDKLQHRCKMCLKEIHMNNKIIRNKRCKENYIKDRSKILYQKKLNGKSNALYETYKDKLTIDENPRLNVDGISLEVKCRYCGKYFIPTNQKIKNKIKFLNGTSRESNLYCSDICKKNNQKPSSKAEVEIQTYISTFNINQINNDRNTILNSNTGHYLELDVYLPDLDKAVEYNGTYWHSLSTPIQHDKIKQEECKRLGIELLVIDEQNYENNKKIELDKIKNFLGGLI